jgi:hypothetical protein
MHDFDANGIISSIINHLGINKTVNHHPWAEVTHVDLFCPEIHDLGLYWLLSRR